MCARLCATNAQKKLESCRSEVGNLPRPRLPVRFVGLDNAADVLGVEHVLGAVVDVVQRVSLVTISSILSSPDLYRPTSFGVATCELSPPKMLPFNVFCNIVNRNGLSLTSTSVIAHARHHAGASVGGQRHGSRHWTRRLQVWWQPKLLEE